MHTTQTEQPPSWTLAGSLVEAMARRDFDALQRCFDDDVRFRALLPRGAVELHGAGEAAAQFRTWFGGDEPFEVADASVGQTGDKMYARWRIRVGEPGAGARIAEQHLFTSGSDRIVTLDLLCSGFQPEAGA